MKKTFLRTLLLALLPLIHQMEANAQSVGIGNASFTPDAQSILDIRSTTKGVLLSRMTTGERTAIASLNNSDSGLTVYDTSTDSYWYWDGAAWQEIPNMGDTGNTLDEAYDENGSGAGRTITADNGAVNIAGPDGLTVNGNVGVGTTDQDYRLHVQIDENSGYNYPLLLRNRGAGNSGTNGTGIAFNMDNAGNHAKNALYFQRTTDFSRGKFHILMNNAANTTAATLADSRLTVLSNGRVGIGTTDPAHRLTVGETTSDGQPVIIRAYSDNTGSWKGGAAFGYTSASVIMGQLNDVATLGGHSANLGAWADLAINPGPGNVGIGTDSPDQKLEVAGNARITGLAGSGNRIVQANASGDLVISNDLPGSDTDYIWNQNSSDQAANFRVNGSGSANVFLVNHGSGNVLEVGDDAWIADINAANTMGVVGNQNSAHGGVRLGSNTSAYLYSDGGANIGIGTTGPSAKLQVANSSPSNWEWSNLSSSVSLELGTNATGNVGSIRLNSYTANQFVFLRPSNGNYHVDATTGQYYFNWDESVRGSSDGVIHMADEAGTHTVELNTAGDSWLTGGNVGVGTDAPASIFHISTTQTANVSKLHNPTLGNGSLVGHEFGKANSTNNMAEFRYNHVSDGSASNWVNLGLWGSANTLNVVGTGNVGVGTVGPTQKLDVDGNARVRGLAGTGNRQVYTDASGNLTTNNGNSNSSWVISANFGFSPDDITAGEILVNADDATHVHNLPFTMTIEGQDYSQISISSNGWIAFGNVNADGFNVGALPSSITSNPAIFPFGTDLRDYGSGENVRVWNAGGANNRVTYIHYRTKAYCGGSAPGSSWFLEFQVQIHEGGLINVKYYSMPPSLNGQQWNCSSTKDVTIGFQLHGGSSAKALPISYNAKVLDDNRSDREGWSVSPVK